MEAYLSEKALSELKRTLQRRFKKLKQEVARELTAANNERYIELSGRVHDSGDESVADLLADVNLAVIDNHVKEIQDIELALMRLTKGSYAICTDCGTSVEYKRLKAYPTAKRCYQCQVQHEKTYAQPHHPAL